MTTSTSARMAPTADRRTHLPGPNSGRKVDLTGVKDEARRSLAPGEVGRELVLALPDIIDDAELDALFPMLVRVLRDRSRESGP